MANASPATFVHGFADLEATDETIQTLRAIYLGLATEVDTHIGRVVDFLKQSGQYDDTLLIVTADHGEMLGDRHCWGKSSFYDASYHVPLIIRQPGNTARAGAEVAAPTESIDIAPTILEWVGQEVPNAMDGRSLLPLLAGDAPDDWRRYTFSELDVADPIAPTHWEKALGVGPGDASLAVMRDDRFTLVEFAADLPPVLFDHHGKGEFENLGEHPDYQVDLARLTRTMLRHRMRNADHTLSMTMITPEGPKTGRR
jgi:arylsulfatase A-like enzyme